jgi:hypothetical protein
MNPDGFMAKTNSAGQIQWAKQLGAGNDIIFPYETGEKTGGGYYIFGISYNSISGNANYTVITLTPGGSIAWSKNYSPTTIGDPNNWSYSDPRIKQLANGDFIMSFNTYKMGLVKTDANGNIQWGRVFYNDTSKNPSFDAVACSDGGFINCGKSGADKMYVKTDANGNVQWSKTYQDPNSYNHIKALAKTSDGNIVSAGLERDWNFDYNGFIMKMDNAGNVLWYKNYANQSGYFFFTNVFEIWGGNLVLCGLDGNTGMPTDTITDASGNIISSNVIGSPLNGFIYNFRLKKAANDDLLMICLQYDFNTSTYNACFFKSDWVSMWWCDKGSHQLTATAVNYSPAVSSSLTQYPAGVFANASFTASSISVIENNYCATAGMSEAIHNMSVSISPNPFTASATVEILGFEHASPGFKNLKLELYDVFGRKVKSLEPRASAFQLDRGNLASGVYLYRVYWQDHMIGTGKIVAE